jgi:hypothetical protein
MLLLAVGTLYLSPSVLGILLYVAHGAEHALAKPGEPTQATHAGPVVHSHDGSTHSHGSAVTILAASLTHDGESGADADPETVPPLVFLAIPGSPVTATGVSPATGGPLPDHSRAPTQVANTPALPPPRG